MDDRDVALVELGRELSKAGYRFVTATPETHRRRLANDAGRGRAAASDARDVFGWSKPFRADVLPAGWIELLRRAEALDESGDVLSARVRVSSLGRDLFFHSAYPTTSADAVFFGPDTYRYARLIESSRDGARAGGTVVDVGCGAGPGGIVALRAGLASRAVLGDVNDGALRLARVNGALAGLDASLDIVKSDVLSAVTDPIDVVVSNPPYLKDPGARTYRDGGGAFGEALAIRIVREALERVRPGGKIIVYTGVAIVDGEDVFLREIEPICRKAGARFRYEELDPDVFGEELDSPAYVSADRIAAVGLHVTAP